MFDEALTSKDPRVVNALRSLMMMVTLTRPETKTEHSSRYGPLRRLFEDMNHLNRRLHDMEEKVNDMRVRENAYSRSTEWQKYPNEKYTLTAAQALAAQVDQDMLNQILGAGLLKTKGSE
jgi:hypothetical protein